jgi:hypothetical protein
MACKSSSAATQSLAFAVALLSRGLEIRPFPQDLRAIDGVPASAPGSAKAMAPRVAFMASIRLGAFGMPRLGVRELPFKSVVAAVELRVGHRAPLQPWRATRRYLRMDVVPREPTPGGPGSGWRRGRERFPWQLPLWFCSYKPHVPARCPLLEGGRVLAQLIYDWFEKIYSFWTNI